MRHSWIIGVLNDLRSYAEMNNLPAVAAAAAQTLGIAEAEISATTGGEDSKAQDGLSTD